MDETNPTGQSALCPFCASDTVIGDASGYAVTDEFLKQMHNYWCASDEPEEPDM